MEHLADSQLAELLSGAATPDLASHIDAHVDRCFDCRQLLLNLARALTATSQPLDQADGEDAAHAASADRVPLLSETLVSRRYRLLGLLGQGGMGRVYRAYDRLLGTEVALKQVLLPSPRDVWPSRSLASDILVALTNHQAGGRVTRTASPEPAPRSESSPVKRARWKILADEFRTLSTLRHPHIVSVLDYGFAGESLPYYTMELLPAAQPLLMWGAGRPLIEQVELLLQLLDALAYLHRRGILHRDLTPNNVLVVHGDSGPVVKVVDFGLAVDAQGMDRSVAGTLLYMAPEIFYGERASELSDLYAVGILAYQMFTGGYPFAAANRSTTLLHQILSTQPDLSALPVALQPVIGQALHKQPTHRQANAATLRRDLAAAAGVTLRSEPAATRDSYLIAARFVGRQAELRVLHAALDEAQAGAGSAWLLSGESGVGKSRFLEELRSGALRHGVLTLRGQAVPGGNGYHLWLDVLRLLSLQVPLDELEAGTIGSLLPDLPMLIERELLAPPALDPSGARLRLFHVVGELLARLPETALVLIEDLQWADSESLALLSHLCSGVSRRALLLVATYREDEAGHIAQALGSSCI